MRNEVNTISQKVRRMRDLGINLGEAGDGAVARLGPPASAYNIPAAHSSTALDEGRGELSADQRTGD
jgi:hypothetical protein